MRNGIKSNAKYQLNSFLHSEESFQYDIDPYDIVILHEIAYAQDLHMESCLLTQKNLAKKCRMSLRQIKTRLSKLVEIKLLCRKKNWKLYVHVLSNVILKQEVIYKTEKTQKALNKTTK